MGHNYQIVIEYDGTNFVGWQYQKNGLSIQEVLEKKLKKVLKDKIRIIGAGRTDAGAVARSGLTAISSTMETMASPRSKIHASFLR